MIPEAIGSLLHHCSKTKAFRSGLSLHAAVFKVGIQADVLVYNHVLNMYAKCGRINFARQVFDEMSERNLVSWSAMISGYDQAGIPLSALDLFFQMHLAPNEYIFSSAISACSSLLLLGEGRQIHAQSFKSGHTSVSFVSNSLISMYMKCGHSSDALSVYSEAFEPNGVSYNALITGFIENQQAENGFQVFKHMHQEGLLPDHFTFVGLLKSCADSNALHRGMTLHCQIIKHRLDSTAFIGNVIMTMYSKFSLVEDVEKAFKLVQEKDVISWNTFIAACYHCENHEKSLKAFGEMFNAYRMRPDDFTFSTVLSAAAALASLSFGKRIHAHLIRTRLNQDVGVDNALTNMYAKCGSIAYAYNVFNRMPHRNLVSWNTIIVAFGNHGLGSRALEHFEQLRADGLEPDRVTFTGLLMACNHAGMVDEGLIVFDCMQETYGIAPDIEHFSCLIDMLGRAGRLYEAEDYMRRSEFGEDVVLLGSLLSACRLHGDVMMGERLAKQLLKHEGVSTSPYVLLSNLYASDEMWDGVAEARKKMKGSGLKKEAGHSMVQVKGGFEKFTVGDFSHSRIDDILDALTTLALQEDKTN
ncbi:putative Pentatricopeptide repeat (PPR) superfamily protein [Hibiscus syriacus]|uniref:Pentatricopeptide repeat (PPR) superfamily protein n=1 Tax=Hibiscus syriacus TaxID=106335 RepID=A0A6A2XMG7_HIBSY|nr:pentatricopeptide repeat-containing protein At3g53360, mitochondrial-like [Hibiscus syriacus]KAE8668165.1 putative Pentatricopeptide repeat (PPR) superfamily protein [Hibiscus syriacus]